jgi:hypothetical protein
MSKFDEHFVNILSIHLDCLLNIDALSGRFCESFEGFYWV